MTHRDKHGTSGLAHAEHRLALHEMESLVKDEGLSIHAASKAGQLSILASLRIPSVAIGSAVVEKFCARTAISC